MMARALGVITVIALALSLSLTGCCAWRGTCKGTEKVIVDCAAPEVTQVIQNLETAVAAILASANYEAALLGLAVQLGKDGEAIVSCIVRHYLEHMPMVSEPEQAIAYTHGRLWLQKHGG
jgi:hypothetical protein